jgi:hypothetical protein
MNDTIKLISLVILNYPRDIAKMLNENGVVVEDASNFTIKQLSDATLTGLTTSKKFNDDFISFVKSLSINNPYSNADAASTGSSFGANYGGIITSGIGALTTLFTANTNNKALQGQLDAQNNKNLTDLQLADKELEKYKLINEGKKIELAAASAKPGGSKTLYIALGIGGVLILGLTIFLVTRNKN